MTSVTIYRGGSQEYHIKQVILQKFTTNKRTSSFGMIIDGTFKWGSGFTEFDTPQRVSSNKSGEGFICIYYIEETPYLAFAKRPIRIHGRRQQFTVKVDEKEYNGETVYVGSIEPYKGSGEAEEEIMEAIFSPGTTNDEG